MRRKTKTRRRDGEDRVGAEERKRKGGKQPSGQNRREAGRKAEAEADEEERGRGTEAGGRKEKAKAYNHLTRLAVLTFYDESVKRAVDKRKVMELGLRAMRAADLCDEYDMQPGADGQVRPKYRDDNYISIALLADAVVDGCCEIAEAKNYEQTLKYIDAFCHYAERPLLKKKDLLKSHPKIDLIGFYGGQAAFMLNKFGRAAELFKLAMNSGNESVRNFAREYYSISLRYAQQGQ